MPIVNRAESDILRLSGVTDIYVNPVDLRGHMSAGLSEVLASYFGGKVRADWESACKDDKLSVGYLWPWESKKTGQILVNVATKRHYADPLDLDHMKRSLCALRDYLQKHPFHRVTMPLFGGAMGQMSIEDAETLHREYLDDLPNVIQISRRPDSFKDGPPKYLAIVGSRTLTDRPYIAGTVEKALTRWGVTLKDFTAVISGGAEGVDEIACGRMMTDPSFETSLAVEYGLRPIIAQADWRRYGRTAGYKRNAIVADIATHCVACLDERETASVGTRQTIKMIQIWNKAYPDHAKELLVVSYKSQMKKADVNATDA